MDMSLMATPGLSPLAMAVSGDKANSAVGTAMLSKTLDAVEQNGAAITKMMEQSVNPHIGGNFDMSV